MIGDMLEAIVWWISRQLCRLGWHEWFPLKSGEQVCLQCEERKLDPEHEPLEWE